MSNPQVGESWLNSREKRRFDIATASLLTPFLGAASLVGAALFFAETAVNPIFVQERSGRGGDALKIVKLRSMPFSDDQKDSSNGYDDRRASRVGKVLRKLALDEAPQLLNIMHGSMSVVGPRPLIHADIIKMREMLSENDYNQWLRSRSVAKPGWLSEFGNVSRSLEAQSDEYLTARFELDCLYAQTASLAKDTEIMSAAFSIGSDLLRRDVETLDAGELNFPRQTGG